MRGVKSHTGYRYEMRSTAKGTQGTLVVGYLKAGNALSRRIYHFFMSMKQCKSHLIVILLWFTCILTIQSKNVVAFLGHLAKRSNEIPNLKYKATLFSTKEEDKELEIFRNRAELSRMALKEKVQQIVLLNNKIDVLQDVVTRVQKKLKEEFEEELKVKGDEHEQKLSSMKQEYVEAEQRFQAEVAEQRKVIKNLRSDFEVEKRESQRVVVAASKIELKLGDQIKALKGEILDMDQALESTQGKAKKLKRLLDDREDKIRDLEASVIKNDVEEELDLLRGELQSALANSELADSERKESLEIATAAVKAAEEREKELSRKVEDLNGEITIMRTRESRTRSEDDIDKSRVSMKKELSRLQQELVNEKMYCVAKMETEREQFEAKLNAERQLHLVELKKLQSQLQDEKEPQEEKKPGKIRRTWKSFKSLFRGRRKDSKIS